MKPTLPLPAFPTIMLQTTTLTSASWESDDACGLVLLLPEGNRDAVEKTPWADALRLRMDAFPEKTNPVLTTTPNGLRTAIGFIGEGVASFKLLTLARKLVDPLLTERPRQIKVVSLLDDSVAARAMAQALVAAVHAAVFRLPKITGKPEDLSTLQTVSFVGDYAGAEFNHALATAEGNNLARWLTQLPGNYLTPALYRNYAETLVKQEGWDADFIDLKRLEKLGAGAFLSVTEASPNRDAGVLHLSYRPKGSKGPALALVGKGICFDTGGTNLKVGDGMLGMHGDMQGSAVALGTFLALTRLGFKQLLAGAGRKPHWPERGEVQRRHHCTEWHYH